MARELGPVNCTTWDWWYFDAMPDDVYISTWDDSSSEGSGPNNASWSSTPDLRIWTVNFNADVVNGSMKYSSVAPPHLPCRLPTPGATEEIVPHVGRANAVPDLMVSVEFTINGTDLKLAGPGYHDKKWGDQLFSNSTDYWCWGLVQHILCFRSVWLEFAPGTAVSAPTISFGSTLGPR
ncbi:hypothetical protein LTR56_023577 [Elasticomyces elasticus]|nr:hypothetical protein LTR56_023577 [Elasticomyces elasticus]KAK3624102.1 hypothetical protein LTR22_024117 [Elasticomyces elasticus]